jgi:tRNA-dihydrouridine synthase
MIRTYFEMLLADMNVEEPQAPASAAAGKMKQFASWFTHGVPGGAALRKSIYEAKTGAAILEAVERFFGGDGEAQRPGSVFSDERADEGTLVPSLAAGE